MCQILIFDNEAPRQTRKIEDALTDSLLVNDDGAGIAWIEDGRVRWRKSVDLSSETLTQLVQSLPRPVVVHSRWATAGRVTDLLCHPFPLSEVNARTGSDKVGVLFHNGVFSPWRVIAAALRIDIPAKKQDMWSDTKVLATAVRKIGIDGLLHTVRADGGDRLCILKPRGKDQIVLSGNWTRERSILVSSGFCSYSTYAWRGDSLTRASRKDRGRVHVGGREYADWDEFLVERWPGRAQVSGTPTAPATVPPIWCARCQTHHTSPCPQFVNE